MSRLLVTASPPKVALQSYLDALLQDAAAELAVTIELDEFEAAVLEEQVRDACVAEPITQQVPTAQIAARVSAPAEPAVVLPTIEAPIDVPVVAVSAVPTEESAALTFEGRPAWGEQPFECLLFDVAGLTLAVPLVCLGSIYPLDGKELTPLFGQPDWFLGLLPSQMGNLKVLDTARWVMPERYRDELRDDLAYVISVQGCDWGLAVHQVSRSIRLDPSKIKWRTQRSQRPWLAGTVIDHMCALLDVSALASLITGGPAARVAAGVVQ